MSRKLPLEGLLSVYNQPLSFALASHCFTGRSELIIGGTHCGPNLIKLILHMRRSRPDTELP